MPPVPPDPQVPSVATIGAVTLDNKPAKSGRRKLWLIAGVVILALAVLAALLGLNATALTPEKRFAKALENHLMVTTISQDYATVGEGLNFTLNTETDFTDPKESKTGGTLSMDVDSQGVVMKMEGEAVSPKPGEGYAKYSEYVWELFGQEADLTDDVKDKWVRLDGDEEAIAADPAAGIIDVNTPLGEVIVGNFDPGLRQEILNKIRADNTYKITSFENEDVDGQKTVRYEVELNKEKLKELNDFVAEKLGIENTVNDVLTDKFTLWVDKNTNRFVKVELKQEEGGTLITSTVTLGEYGEPVNIATPNDAMPYDDFQRLLQERFTAPTEPSSTSI